jgi:ribosomal protein S18 acetylase RimI-like enzyme
MGIFIEHHPQDIAYETFTQLNDLCFPHEPVSAYEYRAFRAAEFWGVFDHEILVGYAVLTQNAKKAHIRRIAIHPDYRTRGLASKLMDAMLQYVRACGVDLVDLLVQQDNRPAIQLYRKYDFQVTGESVQFSVAITDRMVPDYALIPVDAYQHGTQYAPHAERILAWAGQHAPPHKLVLVYLKENKAIGFARFSPDFPGCAPFELFSGQDVGDIHDLVALLGSYALPDKRTIKITTENEIAISRFKAARIKENYSLYQMTKTLA